MLPESLQDDELDFARLPHEILTALAGLEPPERRLEVLDRVRDQLGSVRVSLAQPHLGRVTVLLDGWAVASVPLYRLRRPNEDRLHALATHLFGHGVPVDVADDPRLDWVTLTHAGHSTMVHRRELVDGWPVEERLPPT